MSVVVFVVLTVAIFALLGVLTLAGAGERLGF